MHMDLQPLIHAVAEQDLRVLNIVVRQNGNITAEHDFVEEKRVLLWSASKHLHQWRLELLNSEGYLKSGG